MGSGPMLLGHAHPHVVEAVIKTVEQGSTFFANNDKAVLLAEQLVEAVPCAEKVRFTTSGTDACFQAMRIARAYTGKEKGAQVRGWLPRQQRLRPDERNSQRIAGVPAVRGQQRWHPKAIADLMLIAPFNDLATTEAIIQAHHDEIAAIIVEPMQRILAPRPGFLQGLRDLANRYNIPLIFDEVVTSFRWPTAERRNSTASRLTCARWARLWAADTRWPRCWARTRSCRSSIAERWTATLSSARLVP
ncbi:Glutamate-1-semialdehyde 2,1-aminomutase [Geodia barretti]|uniref:Glutamate-1-semialdehyde 2,1-aminomutase n=1 Tax=Geodia barretti TaxID=519541 RepID=A0AA35TE61_GEOBA|nr:Glutamate-1-semialdehyde 2,1-aminomutase [Geodia barretti]